jgi:uncharacterized membrane protein
MKTNESNLERIIRIIVGLVLVVLNFTGILTGTLGIILAVVGAVLLITGAVGFCPLYGLLKLSTKK